MSDLNFESGSFRDPAGKVFYKNNKIYRKLFKSGLSRFKFLKERGLLDDLIKKGYLIGTKENKINDLDFEAQTDELIISHEKIDFII